MEEAAQVATARAVAEVELVLADPIPGANRVDRHPDLHPVTAGEGQRRAQDLDPHRPLARDRRLGPQPAEAPDRAAGEAEGEPEAAAETTAEARHGKVALPRSDRLDQRHQGRGRGSQVAVAEQDGRRRPARRSSAASAAALTLAPLPWGRARLTIAAPAAIASSAVPSSDASSAT